MEMETGGADTGPSRESGLRGRLGTWVASRLFSNPSGVGQTMHLTERLQQTQAELTRLLNLQREMLLSDTNRPTSPDLASHGSPRPILKEKSSSTGRL